MTPHINAKKEDIASIVIMPGDPLRVKYIAEKYLKDARLVNSVRMNLAYTGYYDDTLITVMSSGMGMGSMGIYAYELFKYYDVRKIIRLGSCGSYFKEINVRDLILAEKAYTNANFAYQDSGSSMQLCKSSPFLNQKIIEYAHNNNIEVKYGNIHTTDVFYNEYDDERIKENYCLAVEMESFALFYIARKLGRDATALLTVSDNLVTKEQLSSKEREQTFDQAIVLVLNTITK